MAHIGRRIVQYKMILKRGLIPTQDDPENVRGRGGLRPDANTHAERRDADRSRACRACGLEHDPLERCEIAAQRAGLPIPAKPVVAPTKPVVAPTDEATMVRALRKLGYRVTKINVASKRLGDRDWRRKQRAGPKDRGSG